MTAINNDIMNKTMDMILEIIRECGLGGARVALDSSRSFQTKTKNGEIELLKESQSNSVTMRFFHNGKSGIFSTSDLKPESLRKFVKKAAEIIELTDDNPAYCLPPASRTGPMPAIDLELVDPELQSSKKEQALPVCQQITAGARQVAPNLVLVDATFQEVHSISMLATTAGFRGRQEETYLALSTEVNVADEGGKKQNGWDYGVWFKYNQMKDPLQIGQTAARRALDMLGCGPLKTDRYQIIVDKEAGATLISWLVDALSGYNIYRQMTCLKDKIGQKIAADCLTINDNPLLPGGMGSSYYDNEGMICQPRPLIENGVLKNYYISNYWSKKIGCEATTESPGNLLFKHGRRSGEEMAAAAPRALYITDFLGGNFNELTGDFSTGIRGFLYENGIRKQAVSEMNLAGNLLECLMKITEVGNDPFRYSSIYVPSLAFEPLMVAGL